MMHLLQIYKTILYFICQFFGICSISKIFAKTQIAKPKCTSLRLIVEDMQQSRQYFNSMSQKEVVDYSSSALDVK